METFEINERHKDLYEAVKEVVVQIAKATGKRPSEIKGLNIEGICVNFAEK